LLKPVTVKTKTIDVDLSGTSEKKTRKKTTTPKPTKADAILALVSTMTPEQRAAFIQNLMKK
jgi:hypothetical protein